MSALLEDYLESSIDELRLVDCSRCAGEALNVAVVGDDILCPACLMVAGETATIFL